MVIAIVIIVSIFFLPIFIFIVLSRLTFVSLSSEL